MKKEASSLKSQPTQPGFTVDEPMNELGQKLMLPTWFESKREELKETLPPVEVRVLEGDQ